MESQGNKAEGRQGKFRSAAPPRSGSPSSAVISSSNNRLCVSEGRFGSSD